MSISDDSFIENKAFVAAAQHVKEKGSSLHLMGLVGSGGVHSCIEHLYSLLWFARSQNISKVFVHAFTDGRDSSPTSGREVIGELLKKFSDIGVGKLATIIGRYFSMDRNNHWDRIAKAYDAMVNGKGKTVTDPLAAVETSYKNKITDEFIEPIIVLNSENQPQTIRNDDAVIFFNFRPDRARQLTKAFIEPSFSNFPRPTVLKNLKFVTMAEYEKNLPAIIAFPPTSVDFPLAAVLSMNNLRQLHIGETEKYAHVTYFINGGRESPFPGEDRIHTPSPKEATYDKKPEMSADAIADTVCEKVKKELYDVYIINFANADMVGHTGNIEATVKAVETIDHCLERVVGATLSFKGAAVITSDHGNAEVMLDPATGKMNTEHTSNPVPFVAVADSLQKRNVLKVPSGVLADVTPTLLSLLNLNKPTEMTGKCLV